MSKKHILLVANQGMNNAELLHWYESAAAFDLRVAGTDEQAIELAHQLHFDLVLADSTDSSIDVRKLEAIMPILNKDVLIVKYAGESFEWITEKVSAAFDSRKAQRIRRLLVLDTEDADDWHGVPRFSSN